MAVSIRHWLNSLRSSIVFMALCQRNCAHAAEWVYPETPDVTSCEGNATTFRWIFSSTQPISNILVVDDVFANVVYIDSSWNWHFTTQGGMVFEKHCPNIETGPNEIYCTSIRVTSGIAPFISPFKTTVTFNDSSKLIAYSSFKECSDCPDQNHAVTIKPDNGVTQTVTNNSMISIASSQSITVDVTAAIPPTLCVEQVQLAAYENGTRVSTTEKSPGYRSFDITLSFGEVRCIEMTYYFSGWKDTLQSFNFCLEANVGGPTTEIVSTTSAPEDPMPCKAWVCWVLLAFSCVCIILHLTIISICIYICNDNSNRNTNNESLQDQKPETENTKKEPKIIFILWIILVIWIILLIVIVTAFVACFSLCSDRVSNEGLAPLILGILCFILYPIVGCVLLYVHKKYKVRVIPFLRVGENTSGKGSPNSNGTDSRAQGYETKQPAHQEGRQQSPPATSL